MRPFAELVSIGRVVKPQGRRGEVLAVPLSDRPDRFPGLRRVFVESAGGGSRELAVSSCWPHKGRFVLKLEGVDSIDDAEGLRGLLLAVGEEQLETLPEGAYYHHQLRGLEVVDEGGHVLGRVSDLQETGATPNLVVSGPQGETLVPLAAQFVRRVDLAGGRLVLAPPVWAEAAQAVH